MQFVAKYSMREALNLNDLFLRKDYLRIILPVIDWQIYFWIRGPITLTPQRVTLWSGLPVLTQIGEAFAGRVAASLLNAIGLKELITTTGHDYETLAMNLLLTQKN